MYRTRSLRAATAAFLLFAIVAVLPLLSETTLEPIIYTIRVPSPESQIAEIEVAVPTEKHSSIELMMAVWSPGFYRVEDYADKVQKLTACTSAGTAVKVEQTQKNRWLISTNGANTVVVNYSLQCDGRTVTTNWVGSDYSIFNGPATYITLLEHTERPQEVHFELPPAWKQTVTSLDGAADGQANHYQAPNFDILADSPIVAGNLTIHDFDVAGSMHYIVDFGDVGQWDGKLAAQKLRLIAEEHRRLLGSLPFRRYVFLNAFRPGAGGLEHLNSTLLTSVPARSNAPTLPWLKFVSHEYFHAINVKRLRPVELGPFDYENPPKTTSLWISEGLTSYYGDLAVTRSGVGSAQDFLLGISAQIRQLQNSPGRLVQTLEQSSLDVWTSSYSGVGGNNKTTVSYYVKGSIVGLLLDAKIRHVTNDTRSLDDVMRLAFGLYSGSRGFKPDEFLAAAAAVAGVELDGFFGRALASTEELDYSEMLEWFGLRFAPQSNPPDPAKTWLLEVRPDATDAQKRHLQHLFAPGIPRGSATAGSQQQP
jgi:predicted metalloprotease with PDZ domain